MISEILNRVCKEKSKKNKIKLLQEADSYALRTVLQGGYNDNITFEFPSGKPPYETNGKDLPLESVCRGFSKLIVSRGNTSVVAESVLIKSLEKLHPDEAELLLLMVEKSIPTKYKGLTPSLIKDAFPSIF